MTLYTVDELKTICELQDSSKAYYRPFICNGDAMKAKVFLVGCNPATPIYQDNASLDEYVHALLDYNEFMKLYAQVRNGKSKSRTRTGIESFITYLQKEAGETSIIETNVNAYPTARERLLKNEADTLIQKGYQIFYELLLKAQPECLILHGKRAVKQLKHFVELYATEDSLGWESIDITRSIADIETNGILTKFKYSDGKECTVLACRHLLNYGRDGASYTPFKETVVKALSN